MTLTDGVDATGRPLVQHCFVLLATMILMGPILCGQCTRSANPAYLLEISSLIYVQMNNSILWFDSDLCSKVFKMRINEYDHLNL